MGWDGMEWDRRGRDGTVGGGKTSEGTEEQMIGGKDMGESGRELEGMRGSETPRPTRTIAGRCERLVCTMCLMVRLRCMKSLHGTTHSQHK